MASVLTTRIVDYAAQECAWQRSGEISVACFVHAWLYAHRHRNNRIRLQDVLALGRLVEPSRNATGLGLRTVGVRVGWDVKMPAQQVPEALDRLIAHQPSVGQATKVEAAEWFRGYEEIHPFVDGNGRTGSLLHLWLLGRLADPIHAPNLWDDPRREYARYPEIADVFGR